MQSPCAQLRKTQYIKYELRKYMLILHFTKGIEWCSPLRMEGAFLVHLKIPNCPNVSSMTL